MHSYTKVGISTMTSGRQSKKLHREAMKMARANWFEYVNAICKWPFRARLRFSWHILRHGKK